VWRVHFNGIGDTNRGDIGHLVSIPSLKHVTKVVLGSSLSMTLTEEGDLYAWRWNRYKNVGTSDCVNNFVPFVACKKVVDFACSGSHTLALLEVLFSFPTTFFSHHRPFVVLLSFTINPKSCGQQYCFLGKQ
jgi:hypothetical protein